jgi:hypothetical protein
MDVIHIIDSDFKVSDLWCDKKWNFCVLGTQIPDLVKQKIRAIPIPRPANCVVSSANMNGMYTPNLAYSWLLSEARNLLPNVRWTWIRKLKALEKIKMFI